MKKKSLFIALALTFNANANANANVNVTDGKGVIDDNFEAKLILLEEKRRLLLLELSSLDNKESSLIKKIEEESPEGKVERIIRHNKAHVMSKLQSIHEDIAKNKNTVLRSKENLKNYVISHVNSAILATKDHEYLSGAFQIALDKIIKTDPNYFDNEPDLTKFYKKIREDRFLLSLKESFRAYAGDEVVDKSGNNLPLFQSHIDKWSLENPEKMQLWSDTKGGELLRKLKEFNLVVDLGELDISLLKGVKFDRLNRELKNWNREQKENQINLIYKIKQ